MGCGESKHAIATENTLTKIKSTSRNDFDAPRNDDDDVKNCDDENQKDGENPSIVISGNENVPDCETKSVVAVVKEEEEIGARLNEGKTVVWNDQSQDISNETTVNVDGPQSAVQNEISASTVEVDSNDTKDEKN